MTVQTRNVYYFGGFDPRGPAFYSRLFRTELRKSAYPTGKQTKLPLRAVAPYIQQVTCANLDDQCTLPHDRAGLNFFLMTWDDIVRCHWPTSPLALLVAGLRVYQQGLAHISLRKVWRISRGTFLAGILPLLFYAASGTGLVIAFLLMEAMFSPVLPANIAGGPLSSFFSASLALVLAYLALHRLSEKTGVGWLVRIFHFNFLFARNRLPEIQERQRAWVEAIIHRQTVNPSDEVVLVGHSVGTVVMLDVARQLIDDPRWRALAGTRPTHLLTLGNCIPLVSLHAHAERFRETLRILSRHGDIAWWDITAKVDPLCFYRSLPTGEAHTGKSSPGKPALHAARFFCMYETGHWKRMRRNKLSVHFLYLMAPDIDCDFNLYRLICSPQPLALHMQVRNKGHA